MGRRFDPDRAHKALVNERNTGLGDDNVDSCGCSLHTLSSYLPMAKVQEEARKWSKNCTNSNGPIYDLVKWN